MKLLNLRTAQVKMAELLVELDEVCRKNDINYFIESGTALGAVRHKGFIPWDDDIDVGMLREDYEKLKKINEEKLLPDDMILQLPETDERACVSWIKLRRPYNDNGELDYDKYIRIDIFPYDYYDENKIAKKQKAAKEILFVKGVVEYSRNSVKKPFFKNLKMNVKILGCHLLNKTVVRKNDRQLSQYIIDKTKDLINEPVDMKSAQLGYGVECIEYGVDPNSHYNYYNISDILPTKDIEFEGSVFLGPNNCDTYLSTIYGSNYMQLPKEEDRVIHDPEIYGL
ncbi:LicD family protein [Inconstantimicrobium porci]|uniref:LicD family protein n=1 Tax=Inconstantimicrobium porci TaxID=2652291 RepID=A0A7X2T1L8_9CLOT|nr:LicD family protein [Inconstantimicrobium porci]MDD6771762.1 LicD family protein [Inconstantimicrobium porci]MSR91801.1 LicD family protein [Inconstantimicrobium porci]